HRRSRSTTWSCPSPAEFSLLVVAQHLDVVVQLCGELDLDALASLEECLEVAVSETPRRLVLDLSALAFIDAAGVAVLLGARRIAEAAGVGFVLDSPTPPVRRVLEIAKLDAAFAIR
ncbi:MAG: STAS domain-containing protein, partial [Acidimicrobiia bacterium]